MRLTLSLLSLLVLVRTVGLAGSIPTNGNEADEPQIVRVSYVQGEVKLSAGTRGSPNVGKDWVAADVNSPIEKGATLATEAGRAEVELEDGSVVYLAEHSVLQFMELTSNSLETNTDIGLLTGRATLAHESNGHSEITLETAGSAIHTRAPLTLRVESALNGAVLRVVEGAIETSGIPGEKLVLKAGDAAQWLGGALLSRVEGPPDDPDQKAWDQWVSEKRAARKADIEEGLKESGLAAPIPGLVDLVREGTFMDCPPYGKCWEPKEGAYTESLQQEKPAEREGQGGQAERKAQVASAGAQSAPPAGKAAISPSPLGARYAWVGYRYYDCPFVYSGKTLMMYTPEHPQGTAAGTPQDLLIGFGWWATCHAGSWAPRRREFRRVHKKPGKWGKGLPPKKQWVVGPKSKGGSFVRVRMGKGVGFIPKSPSDVKGKPPLNVKDGVLMFHGKNGEEVAKIKPAPTNLQIVNYRPGGYEANWTKNMPKVEKPVIEGKLLNRGTGSPSLKARAAGNQKNQAAIRYDYKTQNFVGRTNGAAHGLPQVIAHVSANHGGSGARSGYMGRNSGGSGASHSSASGGGGSLHGNSGGGGSSHGNSGGGGSSHGNSGGGGGGSSHASSSGGGASHASSSGGGGGGGGSSGGGASSSASSASSPGGGHH